MLVNHFEMFKGKLQPDGCFPPHIQEEYLVLPDGVFDVRYLSFKLKEPISKGSANKMINSLFGTLFFNTQEVENQVPLEFFQEHYEFGKYRNVREWISYFYNYTGLILTRKKLFDFISVCS